MLRLGIQTSRMEMVAMGIIQPAVPYSDLICGCLGQLGGSVRPPLAPASRAPVSDSSRVLLLFQICTVTL